MIYGKLLPLAQRENLPAAASGSVLTAHWDDVIPDLDKVYDPSRSLPDFENDVQEWVDVLEASDAPAVMPYALASDGFKWIAMSMLQKAVRRSNPDWALLAASVMINSNLLPTLWRRMAVICLEDLGLAGLPCLAIVLGRLNETIKFHEEFEVDMAFQVLRMMVHSIKDRSACDMASLQLSKSDRWLEAADEVSGSADVNVAVFLDRNQPAAHRLGAHARLLRTAKGRDALGLAYNYMHLPASITHLVNGYKAQHKDPMWNSLPLLWDMAASGPVTLDTHGPTEVSMIGQVPGLAFDMFTSDGKRAMAYFRKSCTEVGTILGPAENWADQLGYAIFAVEGGYLDRSLLFTGRNELAGETLVDEFESVGMSVGQAADLCGAVHENTAKLDHARKRVCSTTVLVPC